MRSLKSLNWVDSMKDEMKSMADNDVWDCVKLPEVKKPLVVNGYLKPKGIQRVTLRDIKLVLSQKALLKKKEFNIKRLSL